MVDPDVCDDSDIPLPLFEEGVGGGGRLKNCGGGLGAGKNGEDGPGDAVNEEPCDDALAFVLQLSATSTARVGCSSGNFRWKSGMKIVGFGWLCSCVAVSGTGWG